MFIDMGGIGGRQVKPLVEALITVVRTGSRDIPRKGSPRITSEPEKSSGPVKGTRGLGR